MKTRLPLLAVMTTSWIIGQLPTTAADAAPAEVKKVTYTEVKPIIDASCVKCHNAEKARAGLHLDTLEGVLQGSKKRKLVEPNNSANSRLIRIVESIAAAAKDPEGKTKALHKRGPTPLTPEQITLLKTWIDQGAKP